MRPLHILVAILALVSPITAATRVENYQEALKQGKASNTPVAALIHGSSWHPASKKLHALLWKNPETATAIKLNVILTHIDVPQSLEGEAAKAFNDSTKPWNPKSVTSFPAVQIYSPDGLLLKTYQGQEFLALITPDNLGAHIDHIATASKKRSELLTKLSSTQDNAQKITLLKQRADLPINQEPKFLETLKAADPEDTSGLQARLSFKNWDFVRKISDLIRGDKLDEASQIVEKHLASPHYTPEQRAFIHAANGRLLLAKDKNDAALEEFQKAESLDPKSPAAAAFLAYSDRTIAIPLRKKFSDNSPLNNLTGIQNLTSTIADYTSSSDDKSGLSPSLLKGKYHKRGFAFHTKKEKNPFIIIDLKNPAHIKALHIANRNRAQERAAGLTVWISEDSENWTQIWQADSVENNWSIILDQPTTPARFVKVGIVSDTPNYLHLQAVDILGNTVKTTPVIP